jgi:crossover junction endodeoxyribonuclease RuvC
VTTIIGIDPGSRITGYGLIRMEGRQAIYVASGCIRLPTEADAATRLQQLFVGLQEIMQTHSPDEAVIEQVFMHRNPQSALKLGQARGVAMVVMALANILVAEYSARQIKQAVVGHGAANKEQVQHMVRILLKLSAKPATDAADALAAALCHAHSRTLNIGLLGQPVKASLRFRRGRMR